MAKKSAKFNKDSVQNLANDKPALYRIQSQSGKDNYVGVAKRGRVPDRIAEHLGNVPGASVKIQQFPSIKAAMESEARVIKRQQPKYNDQGK